MKISACAKKTSDAKSFADVGLSFRSLLLHAWDLADDGVENVMRWARDAGLNTLCLAGTYHSGWFLHPHNSKHRAFMTEGSVCYFHPQTSLWKNTRLRPKVSKLCSKEDYFAEVAKHLGKFDLRLVSWTIGCHNSHLGAAHPELTQQNVYGDRLPFALCPANRDVQIYLKTLCRDLATNYPLWGIQLEAFDWLGFAHGHHHERDLVGLTSFEQELMSWCFCPACADAAAKANVDFGKVRESAKTTLDGVFREAPQRPKSHPGSMAEFEVKFAEAKKMNAWRRSFIASLIASIKSESLAGTNCRLLIEAGFQSHLASVMDGFACFSYGKSPAETLAICKKAKAALPANWRGLLQCFIQLGMGVPESEKQLRQIIAAVERAGCNGINFYNRSEAPPKMLAWLKNVLPDFTKS